MAKRPSSSRSPLWHGGRAEQRHQCGRRDAHDQLLLHRTRSFHRGCRARHAPHRSDKCGSPTMVSSQSGSQSRHDATTMVRPRGRRWSDARAVGRRRPRGARARQHPGDDPLSRRPRDRRDSWRSGTPTTSRCGTAARCGCSASTSTAPRRDTPDGGKRSTTATRCTRSAASSNRPGRAAVSPRLRSARWCGWRARPGPAPDRRVRERRQRRIQCPLRAGRLHTRRHRRVPGCGRWRTRDVGERVDDRHVGCRRARPRSERRLSRDQAIRALQADWRGIDPESADSPDLIHPRSAVDARRCHRAGPRVTASGDSADSGRSCAGCS